MAAGHINRVVGQLRRVALGTIDAQRSDAQLLEGFVARREPAAFELLLHRHGPMVLGVCRRVLRNEADAEDAFQATFLVLVKKAASVVPREQVGNWLYGVAFRTAMKARAMSGNRQARERLAGTTRRTEYAPAEPWPELQAILDEELERLPAKYRTPVVLCDLEGKTHREAARLLGWPDGTLATRLRAARRLLAGRLTRRGLALSTGAVAALVAQNAASAAVPAALIEATARAAIGSAAGAVSVKVAALTQGVVKAMLIAKLKNVAGMLLVAAMLAVGAGGLAYRGQAQGIGLEAGGPQPAASQVTEPGRTGRVTAVGADGLVQINLGTDDNVEVGHVLDVYRLRPGAAYVGRVKVVNAQAHTCVGKPTVQVPTRKIVVGDLVTDELQPSVPSEDPLRLPPAAAAYGVIVRVYANGQNGSFYEQALKQIGKRIATAQSDLEDCKERAAWSARMVKKGLMAKAQADADASRVEAAAIALRKLEKGRRVFEDAGLEISLDEGDGVKVGQTLYVFRKTAKETLDLGQAEVLVFAGRICVAGPPQRSGSPDGKADTSPPVQVGDRVSTVRPSLDGKSPRSGGGSRPVFIDPLGFDARQDVRQAAAQFLALALAGKIDEARPLLDPALPKVRVDELPRTLKAAPPLALVQVATAEALVISAPFDMVPRGSLTGLSRRTRFVIKLERATAEQIRSGWFASDWLIVNVQAHDVDAALTELIDFLAQSHLTAHARDVAIISREGAVTRKYATCKAVILGALQDGILLS